MRLSDEITRMITRRTRSGEYASAEDVVRAALAALDQQESFGDFEEGELDRLLALGERGRTTPAAEVFAEIRSSGKSTRKSHRRKIA